MTDTTTRPGRTLTVARIAQGFRSQGQLDAFYAAFDHTSTCPTCSQIAGAAPIDDGMQPTMGRCAEGRRLETASFAEGSRG